jgi:SAM-dependent methyltransferase
MLSDEYAEILGEKAAHQTSESARWAVDDVKFWDADYGDPHEQQRLADRIKRSRPDAGLRTRPREKHIFRHIREHIPGGTLLDIGCGNGQTIHVLCHPDRVGYEYVGVDLSLNALTTIKQMFPGVFVQASATALPFLPGTFDAVLMLGTLHHLHDPAVTLTDILTLLKPGGLIGMHEVIYRRGHHAQESAHNDYVPLPLILDTLRASGCNLLDVKEEQTVLRHLAAKPLAEPMRDRPWLTRIVLGLDTVGQPLRHIHPALGPHGALITAEKR